MIGMVIANRSMPQKWHWQSGKGLNFVSVKGDSPYRDTDGLVVDEEQKPTEFYQELLHAATLPQQWVLDICCGTGMFFIVTGVGM